MKEVIKVDKDGKERSFCFRKYYQLRAFETLIPKFGSSNHCTTGFGEKQHKHLKRYKQLTNQHHNAQGAVTGQVSTVISLTLGVFRVTNDNMAHHHYDKNRSNALDDFQWM